MKNKTIGYIRTSTSGQDLGLEVQKQALLKFEPSTILSALVLFRIRFKIYLIKINKIHLENDHKKKA